jgi:hypothetical protein
MVCSRLAVATSFFLSAKASYANIKGICNRYESTVHFTNTECDGNNCDAPSMNGCDANRAFIPKCESVTDFDEHHMQVRSDDGHVNFKLWKDDGAGKIYGGSDYAVKQEMADEVSKGEWNIVINSDAKVWLYLASDPEDCPPLPCTVTDVSGTWIPSLYDVVAPTTETWMHGTSKKYSESKTTEWSDSLTLAMSKGLLVKGLKMSAEISNSFSRTYSSEWSVDTQQTFSVTFESKDVGKTVWRFQFDENDSCIHAEQTITQDFALTANAETPPCCLPGHFVNDNTYRNCISQEASLPGEGCPIICPGPLCPDVPAENYVGCYKDKVDDAATCDFDFMITGNCDGTVSPKDPHMSVEQCNARCLQDHSGVAYFGLQYGGNGCFCGNSFGAWGPTSDTNRCSNPCPGKSAEEKCGGSNANAVYKVQPLPVPTPTPPPSLQQKQVQPVGLLV